MTTVLGLWKLVWIPQSPLSPATFIFYSIYFSSCFSGLQKFMNIKWAESKPAEIYGTCKCLIYQVAVWSHKAKTNLDVRKNQEKGKDKCPVSRTMSSRKDRTWQDKQISNRKQNIFPDINSKIGKYIWSRRTFVHHALYRDNAKAGYVIMSACLTGKNNRLTFSAFVLAEKTTEKGQSW